MARPNAKISRGLKHHCVGYVLRNLQDDFFDSPFAETLLDEEEVEEIPDDDEPAESNTGDAPGEEWSPQLIRDIDAFILFGETRDGRRVLDAIRRRSWFLGRKKRAVLAEWKEYAFISAFEVQEIHSDHFRLFDVAAEVTYDVYLNDDDDTVFNEFAASVEIGSFFLTALAPVDGVWFFSGFPTPLGKGAERDVYENFVRRRPSESIYRNNPEKLQKAFALQKEHYDFFVRHYGADETLCKGSELTERELAYRTAWARAHGYGKPPQMLSFPEEFTSAGDVGIVIDEREGTHYLIHYGRFMSVFADSGNRPAGWQDFIREYLEDDSTPAFIFRRMRDRYPEAFREVLRGVAIPPPKRRFDPVADLELLMDTYKPGWRAAYPSVNPLNQRFKKYIYGELIGRNDPCLCRSGKKFKHCCGV